jgi:class 3 adenylate cyclase
MDAPEVPLGVGDAKRRTLQALALYAAPTTVERVAKLLGAGTDCVQAHLRAGCDEGWLGESGDRFHFEDADLARALVAALPSEERVALHHEIAQRLEAAGEGDAELRAHHWLHALPEAPRERVVRALGDAGLAALRARDWRRAAFHFETALAESRSQGAAAHAALHYRAGIAHFRTLDGSTSAEHFDRAAEGYEKAGDEPGALRARVEAIRARSVLSGAVFGFRPPDLEPLAARIAALPEGERALRVYATAMLADSLAMAREPEWALEAAERAVREAEPEGDDLRCRAHAVLGVVQLSRLELPAAVQSLRRALRFGRRLGDPWYEALSLQRLPLILAWLGRMDEAASYLLASRKGSESSGDWADFTLTLGTEAGLANARGDFEEVEQLARQAVSLARRTGYVWGGALALTTLATARALRGRVDDALDAVTLLDRPGLLANEVPPEWAAIAGVTRLRVGVLAGRIEPSARETAAGLARLLLEGPPDVQVLTALCACAEVAVAVDDRVLSQQLSRALEAAAAAGVVFVPSLDDALSRVRGLIAFQQGESEEALERLHEALEAAEQNGARAVEARTHFDCARVLEAMGRDEEARAHRERSLRLARALGMAPLSAAVRSELRDADDAPPGSVRALEADEVALLRALARGFDDAALAQDLLLTPDGLARLRKRLFSRIGATSQVEAAAWAHREGLADLRPSLRRASVPAPGRAPPIETQTRRVLTVFVSDIAHSTERLQRLGDQRGHQLVQDHNRLVRRLLHAHRGVEIQQTGDGFIAVFDEADHALGCALELQGEIEARVLGGAEDPVRIRIGLHSGELLLEEGRVFGVVMHVAAHICGAGIAGSVVVSHSFWDSLESTGAWRSHPLGPTALKGLSEPIELLRVEPV